MMARSLHNARNAIGIITEKAIRRGSFFRVKELVNKIEYFVDHYNEHASPLIWTGTADSILEKDKRKNPRVSRGL